MSCTNPQAPPKPVTVVRGASKTFLLTVHDTKTQLPVSVTGARVWFTVKNRIEDPNAIISKRNVMAGGVDGQAIVVTPQSGATLGQVQVFLDPADTSGLDPAAEFWCDAWVQRAAFLGISTAVGAGSLTDAAQAFVVNSLSGGVLRDSAGSTFPIVSNTATVITVTGNPAAGAYTVYISKRDQVISNRQFVVEPAVTTVFI